MCQEFFLRLFSYVASFSFFLLASIFSLVTVFFLFFCFIHRNFCSDVRSYLSFPLRSLLNSSLLLFSIIKQSLTFSPHMSVFSIVYFIYLVLISVQRESFDIFSKLGRSTNIIYLIIYYFSTNLRYCQILFLLGLNILK